jgi:SNF2-related domain
MLTLDDIKPGSRLRGIDPAGVAEVVQVARFGPDALNLVFRVNGRVGERLVYRGEESGFEFLEAGRSYAFDADGALLRLASEAYRIRLAYLFDPYLAVSASQIEALPHQITAVYGEMLPRQPLRFLLADDPGAGKTIMAGLLIKELLIRGDLERCLIVAPGSLVEQWQDEMSERFEGRFREGVHKADVSDMMRRLTKKLYRFDGTPLFPERCAYTASYSLSPAEADLYQAVTTYVREEMNRADRTGDDKRRMNVGFALQILQRRLASSPAAIHRRWDCHAQELLQ